MLPIDSPHRATLRRPRLLPQLLPPRLRMLRLLLLPLLPLLPRPPLLSALLVLLLLPACSTPYRPPLVPPAIFPGLIDLAAQADGREADVLLVHGICTHDASWAGAVVPQLARALADATLPAASSGVPTAATPPVTRTALPAVEIVPSVVATPAGRLRFDTLIWSPLTNDLKRQLCYDQTGKSALCTGTPPYPHIRARLNARFKDGLIDDCLPDALIYQGVARDAMQQRMREAVLQVLSTARADVPLVIIAHSMGSKMLFDTLLRMTEEPAGMAAALVAQQALDRMRFLVMAANQIPLLSLADQPTVGANSNAGRGGAITPAAPAAAPAPPDSLQLLLRKRQTSQRGAADRHLTLVAFTDPNDLLSYTLDESKYAQDGITVYNILVSNAPTWLGTLERPDRAHLDYLNNYDVGRLIACGQPISKLCI